MSQSLPPPELTLVHEDEFCAKCGYNLKTLNKSGICPECGAAVAPSLDKRPFAGATRRWLIVVAIGLALLILSFILTSLAVTVASEPHDRQAVLMTISPTGIKLWIIARFLQMNAGAPAKFAGLLLLLVHLLAILALTSSARAPKAAHRPLRISLRVLVALAPIFWLFYAWEWRPFKLRNEVQEPAMVCIALYDLACIILTSLLIYRIARRGDHPRYAKMILITMSLQVLGMCVLFYGIYLSEDFATTLRVTLDTLILPSLLMHALGGIGMTIVVIALIFKLWVAAKHRPATADAEN